LTADGPSAHQAPPLDATRPAWRHAADGIEELLGEWMQAGAHGWAEPKHWTAVSVPEFLLAFLVAVERHAPRAEPAADDGRPVWQAMRRALADARWTKAELPADVARERLVAELEAVRAAAPPGPADEDDDELVEAWWRRTRMLQANPPDLLGAWALWWAKDRLDSRLATDDPFSVSVLLDRLLDVPNPDLCAVACCGPLRDVLEDRGPDVQEEIADLCQRHDQWRQAVWAADPCNAEDLDALRPWLP
jgi:hypothetical protein